MQHWLTKQADLSPEKRALELADGTTYTFEQLKVASQKKAYQLTTLGVKAGSKVAILSTNHAEFVVFIHALSYLQAVAVMLNSRLQKRELEEQLITAEADLLITTESLQAEKQLTFKQQITFSTLQTVQETEAQLVTDLAFNAPFTMMFTSGTTGKPKIVVHTYKNHWASAVGSVLNLGLHADDKWLLTLPIFHIGGFSILMKSVIYGMPVYLLEKYTAGKVVTALKEKQVTVASLVTLMLQEAVEVLNEEAFPQSCRAILLGGGSVNEALLQKVSEKNIPLYQSYGMTETSSQIATLGAADLQKKLGSAGKALMPADIKINAADAEGIGEIFVKGPMVVNGYYKNEQANERSFTAGWFKTGDLGYFDEAGFLYIVDRRTDLIISGGENVYPSEVEACLVEIEGIREAVVVGKVDEKWGQVPIAFIVGEDNTPDMDTIIAYAKKQLATFKVPKEIHFIDEVPRNATNKIMRHVLQERFN